MLRGDMKTMAGFDSVDITSLGDSIVSQISSSNSSNNYPLSILSDEKVTVIAYKERRKEAQFGGGLSELFLVFDLKHSNKVIIAKFVAGCGEVIMNTVANHKGMMIGFNKITPTVFYFSQRNDNNLYASINNGYANELCIMGVSSTIDCFIFDPKTLPEYFEAGVSDTMLKDPNWGEF